MFNYAALFTLRHLGKTPQIFLTNDWYCGIAGMYNKSNFFGQWFKESRFVHIFHNLGDDYQGRVYLDNFNDNIEQLTGLKEEFFVDPYWK